MNRFVLCSVFLLVAVACRSGDSAPPPKLAKTAPGFVKRAPVDAAVPKTPPAATPTPPVTVTPNCPPPTGALTTKTNERLSLVAAQFSQLPGWTSDRVAKAIPPFVRSCAKLALKADSDKVGAGPFGGVAKDWRAACAAVKTLPANDDAAARAFFQRYFKPYAAHGTKGDRGVFTGYYVQRMQASMTRGGAYQFPLWERPKELVSVELSEFVGDGRGRTLWGMVKPGRKTLVPYPSRKDMRRHSPRPKVLVWVNNPVDAIAVEIEGSGVATMKDGSTKWIHFAGKNGQKGGRLRSTLRKVRGLKRRLRRISRARQTRSYYRATDPKKSIVFFKFERRNGAIGTQDVILTPRRSLAVDRAVIPMSTPVFVDTRAPSAARGPMRPWRQLLIAQDTGGAIVGPIRGDIYWGADKTAAAIGGRMHSKGRMWLLLPKGIRVPTRAARTP